MVIVRRYAYDLQPGMLIHEDDGDTFRIGAVVTEPEDRISITAISTYTGELSIFRFKRMEFVKTAER